MAGLELYWQAFLELSTDRPQALSGVTQIPFTAICKYAEMLGIKDVEFEDLLTNIRAMDDVFIKEQNNG